MEFKGKKLELDLEELMPLLVGNKQEAFRQIGEKLLNSVLEKEFESFIGASKHERSEERSDYRNGHKERQLKTTLGELNLLRPYARSGKFETKLFENYSRIDKALVSMIVESYLKGVSTRKVESVISELGIELSHATVSNLSHELDELITDFRTSPLKSYYPYLYTDSAYLKVFNGSRFVSMAVMIAVGVNDDGYREILDIDIDILFDKKQIKIMQTRVAGKDGTPKTMSSMRYVDILPQTLEVLQSQQKLTGDKEYLFYTRSGKRYFSHDTLAASFKRLLIRNKIKERVLYNLRHTFASQMISQGVDIVWVSKTLGHKDVSITLSTYTKFIQEDEATRFQKLEKFGTIFDTLANS